MDDILQVLGLIFIAIIVMVVIVFGSMTIMKPYEFKACMNNIEKYPAYAPYWEDKGSVNYGCYVNIDKDARVDFIDIQF
jgi:hypothetical protein